MTCQVKVSAACTCTGDCRAQVLLGYGPSCQCGPCLFTAVSGGAGGSTMTAGASPSGGGGSGAVLMTGGRSGATWKPVFGAANSGSGAGSGGGIMPAQTSRRPRPGTAGVPGFDSAGSRDFELAMGSVRGFRYWTLPVGPALQRCLSREDAEPCVASLGITAIPLLTGATGRPWNPGVNKATCNNFRDHKPPVEYDEARGSACGCGHWAYWTVSDSQWLSGTTVAGIIDGTGRVLIGEKGFRAEQGKILALAPAFTIDVSYYNDYAHPGNSSSRDAYGNVYRYGDPYDYLYERPVAPPGPSPEEERARAQQKADAWMAVLMDLLGSLYPEARVFATVKGMLATFPPGEVAA